MTKARGQRLDAETIMLPAFYALAQNRMKQGWFR
jgi:hypothetical protein|tara:strand:- start:229 stop:330 length:102 start_codon:yes stop_codon:yes gene_type:complete